MEERTRYTKIKTFTYHLTEFGMPDSTGSTEWICDDLAIPEVNSFMRGKDVIDVKVNTYEARYHNNGGIPLVMIAYTIIYVD